MLTPRRVTVPDDPGTVLCVSCIRNELERLPHFLSHHRSLGVGHFLFVVNESHDGSAEYLLDQPDCSVWSTDAGYKAARFGMDWLGFLLLTYGSGRWCLTLDADELLIYPHWETHDLKTLIGFLEDQGQQSFGTLSVDLYPRGPLSQSGFKAGENPVDVLTHMDADPYRRTPQPDLGVDLYQGGVRDRIFFADAPRRAPTMNKLPLVRWHWRYAYRNSTHTVLPPRLNAALGESQMTGALLHTKFLPSVLERSVEEKTRQQHFAKSEAHHAYFDALASDPVFWSETHSVRYMGWQQLVDLGLMCNADWGK